MLFRSDPSAACVARAEATAAAARAEGAAWAGRLAFARGCFEGLRAAGVEDASFDVVIVNSVLNLAWDLKEALRETARAIAWNRALPWPGALTLPPSSDGAELFITGQYGRDSVDSNLYSMITVSDNDAANTDRKSTRLNSSQVRTSRMPSSA